MCVCVCAFVCVCALCCSLHIVQYLLCSMTGNTQSDREREREGDRESCHLNVVAVTHSPNVFFFFFIPCESENQKESFCEKERVGEERVR